MIELFFWGFALIAGMAFKTLCDALYSARGGADMTSMSRQDVANLIFSIILICAFARYIIALNAL